MRPDLPESELVIDEIIGLNIPDANTGGSKSTKVDHPCAAESFSLTDSAMNAFSVC